MHFKIKKNLLEKYVNIVDRAIDTNNTFVQLRGIYINVYEREIELIGSDDELSIRAIIEANNNVEIYETGSVLVFSNMFRKLISKLQNEISIILQNNKLIISAGETKYELNLLKNQDYPVPNFSLSGQNVNLNFHDLKNAVNNTIFIATEKDNDIKAGALSISADNGIMNFFVTDGFRLGMQLMKINKDIKFEKLIRGKNIKRMLAIDGFENVELYVDQNSLAFSFNNVTLKSKLIEVMFTRHDDKFPNDFITTIKIDKRVISDLINKIISNNEDNHNRFTLVIEENKLSVKSSVQELVNVVSSTDDFEFQGIPLEIDFNLIFFKEAINVFDGTVNLLISNKAEKLLVLGKSNEGNRQLIAPMRRA